MNLLYFHQYFVTPEEYGASRSYWFARKLIEHGHKVTVISALSSVTVRLPGSYDIDGIRVIYVGNKYTNLMSSGKKVMTFFRFIYNALKVALSLKDVDLVYATSTPLTVGVIAVIYKKLKRKKFIFEVRDLWPEFPVQIGAIKNPAMIWFLRQAEKLIYRNAIHIVALSPGMKDGIMAAGTPETKITVIPNMSKPDIFFPRPLSANTEPAINHDKFNIIHFGSMGRANGLEFITDTARILKQKGDNDIMFVMAGYGTTEAVLRKIATRDGLDNIQFVGKHNTFIISELVNQCDASLISFMNLPVLRTNSPNKLFDSLSAGKPVIVNSDGWTHRLVEDNDCGFYTDPEKPEEFADKLIQFKSDKLQLATWSENARKLSLNVFDKELLAEKFVNLIESIDH